MLTFLNPTKGLRQCLRESLVRLNQTLLFSPIMVTYRFAAELRGCFLRARPCRKQSSGNSGAVHRSWCGP